MNVRPLRASTKSSFVYVEFRTGKLTVPIFHRYTNTTRATVLEEREYASVPAIDVKASKRTGTLEEATWSLTMVADDFLRRLSSGEPHAPVDVRILERIEEDGRADVLTLFNGRVARAIRNPQGRSGLVRLELRTWKGGELDILGGIPCHGRCPWIFTGRGCFLAGGPALLIQTGTLTAIDGATVTITGLTPPRDRYFDQGFVELDGLRIGVKDYDSGTDLVLRRQPPDDWLNETVEVMPGCDKELATCKLWLNEDNFGGVGRKMQPRNVLMDSD